MDILDPPDHPVSRASERRLAASDLQLYLSQAVQAIPASSLVPPQGKDSITATSPAEDESETSSKLLGEYDQGLARFSFKEESEAATQSLHRHK